MNDLNLEKQEEAMKLLATLTIAGLFVTAVAAHPPAVVMLPFMLISVLEIGAC